MKYLKTYEDNTDKDIIGSKRGDKVVLDYEVSSFKKGVYVITNIAEYDDDDNYIKKLPKVTNLDDYIFVINEDDINNENIDSERIRAHFFIPELDFYTNKYNI